jgi:hypothetical protein
MDRYGKTARLAGIFFLLTFVTSIPAVLLYEPLLKHTNYILGAGADHRIAFGAFLEVLLAISNIATAVVLFPILRRQSESLSLGYVASRTLESTIIVVGLISVMTVVTLRQDLAGTGANAETLTVAGRSLVAFHDWTFLLGPQFCAGLGNGLLLGYLLYASRLVPPRMALIGVFGGPLAFLAGCLVLLGAIDQGSAVQGVLTIPEFIWELALAIYLIVKGFRASSPLLAA